MLCGSPCDQQEPPTRLPLSPSLQQSACTTKGWRSVQEVDTEDEGNVWSNVGGVITAFRNTKAGAENYTDQLSTLLAEDDTYPQSGFMSLSWGCR